MTDLHTPTGKKEIAITIINSGGEQQVKTYPGEYRNLMVLLNNSIFPEGFGECGGQGRCGTCLIKISGPGFAEGMVRNELATLEKMRLSDQGFRLSCQVHITDALNGAVVILIEDGF